MSIDRFRLLQRGALAGLITLASVVAAESCGFPDKSFIDDDTFYGRKGSSGDTAAGGGAGGMDASMTTPTGGTVSAGGMVELAGQKNAGGSAGMAGKDGGQTMVHREGGRGDGGSPGNPDGGGTDGATDGGDAGPRCALGLSDCSGVCTDLQTNKAHCGKCITACSGGDICTAGKCSPPCDTGLTACTPTGTTTETCVDTNTDQNHCGKCNQPCPGGTVCEGAKCVIDCGSLTRCGTQCFDTTKDDTHCGNCTNNCTNSGQVCSGGVCKTNCTPPFTACNSTCVNLQTDNQNCNMCGKACTATQGCVAGVCKNLVEDCQNGSDDDRDGKVDCADTDCQTGYVCASTPSGWTGPVAVWTGTSGGAPSCSVSGAYPAGVLIAHDGISAPSYTCPTCTCKPSSGSFCKALDFYYDQTAVCDPNAAAWTVTATPDGNCTSVILGQATPSAHSSQLIGSPSDYVVASCVGGQSAPQFPPATWSNDVRACGNVTSSGAGCAVGQCFPKPKAPFGTQLCIFRPGIASCPSDYPVQRPGATKQFFETWLEGRSCSSCSCGAASCGGTVHTFTDANCNANDTVAAIDGACTTIPLDSTQDNSPRRDTRSIRWDNAGPVCGTPTSQLSGSPQPDSPVTVCCQP